MKNFYRITLGSLFLIFIILTILILVGLFINYETQYWIDEVNPEIINFSGNGISLIKNLGFQEVITFGSNSISTIIWFPHKITEGHAPVPMDGANFIFVVSGILKVALIALPIIFFTILFVIFKVRKQTKLIFPLSLLDAKNNYILSKKTFKKAKSDEAKQMLQEAKTTFSKEKEKYLLEYKLLKNN
ncbi:hypothetical protein NPX79_00295 [Spiroplasma endosymbiont of Anurida maritima]|uniref:hypothetical protein n=1 Tax=Spiroplasma endosymbiont of Anurida maritima TaxID=2967972 RepID=UPI0036D2FB6C